MKTDPAMQRDDGALGTALMDTAVTGMRVVSLRLAAYAVGFVASILIARTLGPHGRGLYAYPVALVGIVVAVGHLGLEQAHVFQASRGTPMRTMWANAAFAAVGIGLVAGLVLSGLYAWGPRQLMGGLPFTWIVVPLAQVPFLLQSMYWTSLLQLDGRLLSAMLAVLAGVAVHAILAVALIAAHLLTPFAVLVLLWSANGTIWLLLLRLGVRAGIAGAHPDWRVLGAGVTFGLKAHMGLIFFFLLLRVDQVLVRGFLGYRALGIYALAATLAELVWLLTDPIAMSLLPHQVRAAPGDDRRLGFTAARMSLVVAVAGAAAAWLLAPHAIRLAYGEAYVGAVWPLRLLLPGVVALAVQRPLGAVLLKEGRPWLISALGVSALAVNVALNLLLLPVMGIAGASLASTGCYTALAVAYVLCVRSTGTSGWPDLRLRRSDVALLGTGLRQALRRSPRTRELSDGPGICFVIGSLRRGGTERQLAALAAGMRRRGWRVTVICLSERGALANELEAAGVDVEVAGFHGLSPLRSPLPVVRQVRSIYRVLRRRRPHVVQCYLYWGYLLGVPLARLARVPVVVSSRRGMASTRGARAILRPLEALSDRLSDAIVCNSRAVLDDAVTDGKVPRAKALFIANGVDIQYANPPRSSRNGPRILCIANLRAVKGHDVLLRAFAMTLMRADPQPRLQLAGMGPEEPALRGLAARLGISDSVEFLGSTAQIDGLLEAAAFTVLPSLSEGMPNVVLESMASARAVVASSSGGATELLAEGGGVLVPPGDADLLARAMDMLLERPERAEVLGAQGRWIVEQRYTMDRMIDETLVLYRRLLASNGLAISDHEGGGPDRTLVGSRAGERSP